jgi:multidrug efflux pump subunit AcrA (membrane-fusion protein)
MRPAPGTPHAPRRDVNSDRGATRGCGCRRPTCAASARPRERSPPWLKSIAIASPRISAPWTNCGRRASLEERRTRLDALRVEARQAQAEVERAAAARSDAIRNIDRQRDLNAQLAGELQGAQQKLQAALRSLAPGPTTTHRLLFTLGPFEANSRGPHRAQLVAVLAGRRPVRRG